jgi:hypothetical protein
MGNKRPRWVLLCTVMLLWLLDSMGAQVSQRGQTQGASMGVEVYIYLFDTHEYEHSVLPAYRSFKERADKGPLLNLLRSASYHAEASQTVGEVSASEEIYQHYADILSGRQHYDSERKEEADQTRPTTAQDMRLFVDDSVAPGLVTFFCLPRDEGIQPEQGMSSAVLMNYLYSQSKWIEDYFTFAKEPSGAVPEIKIGDWSRFFSREEVLEFDDQLSKMQRPNNDEVLADGFDNLRALVHAAANNPNFAILLVGS